MGPARRIAVAALAAIVGIGAELGAYGLLTDAAGLGIEEAWLDGTPFPDYTVPGVVLGVVVGAGMLAVVTGAVAGSRRAGPAAAVMGVVLLGWGAVETTTIAYQGWPQLALLAAFVVAPGLVLVAIGSAAEPYAPSAVAPAGRRPAIRAAARASGSRAPAASPRASSATPYSSSARASEGRVPSDSKRAIAPS